MFPSWIERYNVLFQKSWTATRAFDTEFNVLEQPTGHDRRFRVAIKRLQLPRGALSRAWKVAQGLTGR